MDKDGKRSSKDGPSGISRRGFIIAGGAAALLAKGGLPAAATTGQKSGVPSATVATTPTGAPLLHGSPSVVRGSALPNAPRHMRVAFLSSPMGRMFPTLPAHVPTEASLATLAAGLVEGGGNLDNPALPAGFTFLGQYIDHDITLDEISSLQGPNDPGSLESERSAALDLDSLYGDGPAVHPQLYEPADNKKLRLVTTAGVQDIPRNPDGTAIIADPRNDQHRIISQIQKAFARFHNRTVDDERAAGRRENAIFTVARRQTQFHYQWLMVHDYLPKVAGQDVVDQVLVNVSGTPTVQTQFFNPTFGAAFIPVEFSVAAFRFGHTQIRPIYRLNSNTTAPILGPTTDQNNLNGGRVLTSQFQIQWENFFEIRGNPTVPQRGRLIDDKLNVNLSNLPVPVIPAGSIPTALAARNLLRGRAFGLPSGQAVAAHIGAPVLSNGDLGLSDPGLNGEAPLWFYILKEAELLQAGQRLGPVGARIVVEVLLGLMKADPNSYLSRQPRFRPRPPQAFSRGVMTTGDFLRFAGVA